MRLASGRRLVVTVTLVLCYLGWLARLVVAHRLQFVDADIRFVDSLIFSLAWLGLPAIGGMLVVRRPGTPVGWMMLLIGACFYILEPIGAWARYVAAAGGEVHGWLLWGAVAADALLVLPVLGFAILLLAFPDGLGTRVSTVLAVAAVVVTTLVTVIRPLRPASIAGGLVTNPLGLAWVPEQADQPFTAALFAITGAAFLRLLLRARSADGVERKQLQWVLTPIAAFPVLWVVGNAVEVVVYAVGQYLAVSAFAVTFLGLSVALHRAVTRHDLYGIDRLVSRTLTYALLTGVLVGGYLGLVLLLSATARAVAGETGDLVVALSTLAVAALAAPARRRIHTLVDRRFNRARYDAARTIDDFGRGLRDELGLDAVVEQLGATATVTFGPRLVGVTIVATEGGP